MRRFRESNKNWKYLLMRKSTNGSLLSNIERANFKDSIMIHVIDDSKNEKRDFTFSRSLLVKYMKYFDKCLKKISD